MIAAQESGELATRIGLQWQACFDPIKTGDKQFIQRG
jgi:hypothetical protein